MRRAISRTKSFLDTHEVFITELRDLLKTYMREQDSYVYSNTYVTEFIEKYEHINLEGYNSGGYAYKESKEVVFDQADAKKAEETKQRSLEESQVIMPVPEKGFTMEQSRRVSVLDRFKKAIGMKVGEKGDEESKV